MSIVKPSDSPAACTARQRQERGVDDRRAIRRRWTGQVCARGPHRRRDDLSARRCMGRRSDRLEVFADVPIHPARVVEDRSRRRIGRGRLELLVALPQRIRGGRAASGADFPAAAPGREVRPMCGFGFDRVSSCRGGGGPRLTSPSCTSRRPTRQPPSLRHVVYPIFLRFSAAAPPGSRRRSTAISGPSGISVRRRLDDSLPMFHGPGMCRVPSAFLGTSTGRSVGPPSRRV